MDNPVENPSTDSAESVVGSKEATKWEPIKSLPEEELKRLLFGLLDGKAYSSAHCPDDIELVFAPIALGALAGAPSWWIDQVGLIYEWLEHAGTRGVNGHPMFFSMRLLNKEDWERLLPALLREEERRKNVTL